VTGGESQTPIPPADLSKPPPNHVYKASVEREEYASERFVRLFKDLVVFLAAIFLSGVIAWLCCRALISPSVNPDEQKWAMSILSGMMGGIVGYLVKR
jgi:hypothetical protein